MVDNPPCKLHGARALVTGATGFVGGWLTRALHDRGAEIAVAVRDADRLRAAGCPTIPGDNVLTVDCAQAGQLASAIAAFSPDVVFHLAGYGVAKDERDADRMQRLNADVLGELLQALARNPASSWTGQRLVHTGSAFEYGARSEPLDETLEPHPVNAYGESKLAGTRLVQDRSHELGVASIVARLFTVFGPGEREGRLFPTLLAAADHDEPIALSSGEQQRDFTLVWDAVDALLGLALLPASLSLERRAPLDTGIVNVASGRLHPVRAFIEAAARCLAIDEHRLQFGKVPQMAEDVAMSPVPIARLQAAGIRTPSGDLDEMFARIRQWRDGPPRDWWR